VTALVERKPTRLLCVLLLLVFIVAAGATGCRPPAAAGTAAERAAAERAAAERAAERRAAEERTRRERGGLDLSLGATPVLTLSPAIVADGSSYIATASGFWPTEQVQFSWTGLSDGVITTANANAIGQADVSVLEGAAPGDYLIIARGLGSGLTASASLQVIAG